MSGVDGYLAIPNVVVKPEWEKFVLPFNIGSGRSFVPPQGRPAMRMAFFRVRTDGSLAGKVWFGAGIEGPPGHVHGGVSSYVLDEAMGSAVWLGHYAVVARKLEIQFMEMTPVQKDLDIVARVEKVQGRTVLASARIFDESTLQVYSQARGEFFRLSHERIERLRESDQSGFDFSKIVYP